MKKPKIKMVFMIVSLLFFVATFGLIISMSKIDKQTEDTTTFYTATVIGVDVTNTGENIFDEIHTKEYRCRNIVHLYFPFTHNGFVCCDRYNNAISLNGSHYGYMYKGIVYCNIYP